MAKKQEKAQSQFEGKGINSPAGTHGPKGGSVGAYTTVGATKGMNGKAKGGHPTIRAQEMKGC